MSVQLSPISLAGAVVGTTGQVDFSKFARRATQMQGNDADNGTLVVYSESGCGLTLTLDQSQWSSFVPAGGWKAIALGLGDLSFTYQVVYTLPNPPVSLLVVIYYQPGQAVDDPGILGNSPIGLSGSVQTAVTQVVQDGQPTGQVIVEATPSGNPQRVLITTDGVANFLKINVNGGQGGFPFNIFEPANGVNLNDFIHMGVTGGVVHEYRFLIDSAGNFILYDPTDGSNVMIFRGSQGVQITKAITSVGGTLTSGAFGVPIIVAQNAGGTSVVTTGDHIILTFTPPARGLYRVSGYLEAHITVASAIVVRFTYEDDSGVNTAYLATSSTGATNPVLMNGGTSFLPGSLAAPLDSLTVLAKPTSNIICHYNSPSGAPNDGIWFLIEQLQ